MQSRKIFKWFVSLIFAMAGSAAHAELYVSTYGLFGMGGVGKFDESTGLGEVLISGDAYGLAFGRDGHLYVAKANRVDLHDASSGGLLKTFEAPPTPPGLLFRALVGLAFDGVDTLYTVDLTGEVLRYSVATGAVDIFVERTRLGNEPQAAVLTPDGSSLLVSSDFLSRIWRFSATDGSSQGFFANDGFYSGQAVFGPDGNLYVTDLVNDNVRSYNGATGALIGPFAAATGLVDPYGLGFGPDGNLYVTSAGDDRIYVFDGSSGALLRSFATGMDLHSLSYIAFSTSVPEPHVWMMMVIGVGLFVAYIGRAKFVMPGTAKPVMRVRGLIA